MTIQLQPLPYAAWEPTKTTLHLWSQIVGKVALQCAPQLNHWWSVRLRPTARGLSTHLLRQGDIYFQAEFDFADHTLSVTTNRSQSPRSFALTDGLSVSDFYRQFFELLASVGISVQILAKPYGIPITTPFADDHEHHTYDREMVRRWWEVLLWSSDVFDRFAATFTGKQSEPELFWHSFDIAMGRYSGRRAGGPPKHNIVEQDAYSHEVISFGFWPGDANVPEPTYYTYTAPEPPALVTQPLLPPRAAAWHPSGAGHLGSIAYETVRTAIDPEYTLAEFLESGYEAGIHAAHWNNIRYARFVQL